MSLTIKHLNSDTSFLLTFSPTTPFPPQSPSLTSSSQNYTILLDPWLVGPSNIFHQKFSTARHKTSPCISSLTELPEPDLVIISQSKSDHCHKQTLLQLPASGGKTVILAEPAAAKIIRGWKYFAPGKVVTLPRWETPKNSKSKTNIHTIPVSALAPNGVPGAVSIAYLSQKPDLTGLHSAIGITYRSPISFLPATYPVSLSPSQLDTPPLTPASTATFSTSNTSQYHPYEPRPLSLIYSPHGIPYKYLQSYISYHLVPQCALPLTALLHCFDTVQNAWYLGGNICSGFPGGLQIAQNLCARVWVSAHDGEKEVKGIANGKLEVRKYDREEVESIVSPRSDRFPMSSLGKGDVRAISGKGTEVVVLGSGEEIRLSAINAPGGGMIFSGGGLSIVPDIDITDDFATSIRNSDTSGSHLGTLESASVATSFINTPSIRLSVHA